MYMYIWTYIYICLMFFIFVFCHWSKLWTRDRPIQHGKTVPTCKAEHDHMVGRPWPYNALALRVASNGLYACLLHKMDRSSPDVQCMQDMRTKKRG